MFSSKTDASIVGDTDNTKRKPLLSSEEKEEFTKQTFPFENIALEGGGCKGSSYVGTIRVSDFPE